MGAGESRERNVLIPKSTSVIFSRCARGRLYLALDKSSVSKVKMIIHVSLNPCLTTCYVTIIETDFSIRF